MRKLFGFVAFLVCMGMQWANAQERTVTGLVTDASDGSALPGVTVQVKGTTMGTSTDIEGKFSLKVSDDAILLVSFIGMKSQEVAVKGKEFIHIKIHSDMEVLDEVMVVAYGTAKKSSFTGSAVSIGSQKMENRPLSNAVKALEGATAGVQMNGEGGQPGEAPNIRIRGFGSVNASNSPLYIVDGVPLTGAMSSINSDDIESISILKDASSSALYGNRAANGVVLITTKKGKKEKMSFNVKINQGLTTRGIAEYNRVNAYEYVPLVWEGMRNGLVSGGTPVDKANMQASGQVSGKKGVMDQLVNNPFNVPANEVMRPDGTINPDAKLLYPEDLDWEDAIKRTGYRHDYTVSGSGGTEKSDYYVSVGYTNEEGYAIDTKMERMTARANVNLEPRKWVKFGLNLSGALAKSSQVGSTSSTGYKNPFFFSRNMGPIYPIHKHNPDGSYVLDENGDKIYEWDNRGAGASAGRHIVAERDWDHNSYKRNELVARTFMDLNLYKGLKFTANVSYDLRNNLNASYDNPHVGDGAPSGRANRTSYRYDVWNYNQLLTYQNSIGNHHFDVLLGHESYDLKYEYLYGMRQGLVAEGNDELINFTTTNSLTGYNEVYRTEGYLARANYNYADKYYLSASYRRDGSSRFHEDARWGNFWSVGASWRMDQENFIKKLTWIDQLKIRASYGEVGNDNVLDGDGYTNYYAWQSLYGIQRNANDPGFIQSTEAGNKDIEWETNKSFDVALEFGVLNRIRGAVEYFYRKSDNLLFSVPLPESSGKVSQWQNIGSMYNEGIEFSLNADAIVKGDFRWNIDFNLTHFKNEVSKLPQDEIISGTKKLMKGHSIYDFYLRDYMGVDPETGDAMYRADVLDDEGNKTGEEVVNDVNSATRYYHGSAIPDVYGAMTNSFSWRGIDLSFLLTYQIGGKVYDGAYANLMSFGYGSSLHKDMLKRWQKPGDKTNVPRLDEKCNTDQLGSNSTRWLTNASYLAMKSASLAYSFPKSVTSKLDIASLRVYVSGENLFLINRRKGMNNQYGFAGTTSNAYSPARIFTFGINIGF